MAQRKAARDALQGEETLILDVISEVFKPEQWAAFLRVLLEGVAVKGHRCLAQKLLVGAGAAMGGALHEAVRGGHNQLVKDLLQENGASASSKDRRGNTPPHVAAEVGDVELLKFLLLEKTENVDTMNGQGFSPLHISAQYNRVGVGRVLIDAGADVNLLSVRRFRWSAAHMAAREGHAEFLGMLIENGASVNAVSPLQYSPLHFALRSRNSSARVIDMLVEAGANLETKDSSGSTPLLAAARAQSYDAVLTLLEHGAEVNATNTQGETPLHHAALNVGGEAGAAKLVDLLLRAGADETSVDANGQKPVDIVGECVEEGDEILPEETTRVRHLLANAPADRAWCRRGHLVLCRAHPDRMQLLRPQQGSNQALVGGCWLQKPDSRGEVTAVEASSRSGDAAGYPAVSERSDGSDWITALAWVLGVQEEGVFRMIVGFL